MQILKKKIKKKNVILLVFLIYLLALVLQIIRAKNVIFSLSA